MRQHLHGRIQQVERYPGAAQKRDHHAQDVAQGVAGEFSHAQLTQQVAHRQRDRGEHERCRDHQRESRAADHRRGLVEHGDSQTDRPQPHRRHDQQAARRQLQPVGQGRQRRHEVASAQIGAVERGHHHADAHDDGGEQGVGAPLEEEHEPLRLGRGSAHFHAVRFRRFGHGLGCVLHDIALRSRSFEAGVRARDAQVRIHHLVHQAALGGVEAVHRLERRQLVAGARGFHERVAEPFRNDEDVRALTLGHGVLQCHLAVFDGHFDALLPQVGRQPVRQRASVAIDHGELRLVRRELAIVRAAERQAACDEHAHHAQEAGVHDEVHRVPQHRLDRGFKDLHSAASL